MRSTRCVLCCLLLLVSYREGVSWGGVGVSHVPLHRSDNKEGEGERKRFLCCSLSLCSILSFCVPLLLFAFLLKCVNI
jgi:hypothetical protein